MVSPRSARLLALVEWVARSNPRRAPLGPSTSVFADSWLEVCKVETFSTRDGADQRLATDRALDQAWRGGVGVATAVTRAEKLNDPRRLDALLDDAKEIVSTRHACSPFEALTRLCFVSWHTNRRLHDIASEVVAFAADHPAVSPTSPLPAPTGSRSSQEQGSHREQVRSQVREHEAPRVRRGDEAPRLPPLSQSNRSLDLPAAGSDPSLSGAVSRLVRDVGGRRQLPSTARMRSDAQ